MTGCEACELERLRPNMMVPIESHRCYRMMTMQTRLQADVAKIEFKPSPDPAARCGYVSFDYMVAGSAAPPLRTCEECRGSGKYRGLALIEDCRACAGKGRV